MLGFNIHDVINTKVQAILQAIKEAFGEKIQKLNSMFQATELIFVFMATSL